MAGKDEQVLLISKTIGKGFYLNGKLNATWGVNEGYNHVISQCRMKVGDPEAEIVERPWGKPSFPDTLPVKAKRPKVTPKAPDTDEAPTEH